MEAILQSVLTCPHCGAVKKETMPTDACQFFYECTACHIVLHQKSGDCCVFCSFATVPCPPVPDKPSSPKKRYVAMMDDVVTG